MPDRELLTHYMTLVVLPALALFFVLHFGERLRPMPSIAGDWRLDADLTANQNTPCSRTLGAFSEAEVRISQSGVFLEVQLPNPARDRLLGRFDGERFLAEARPALFGDDVFDLLRISGTVEKGEDSKRILRGLIAMPRLLECVTISFVARQGESGGGSMKGGSD